MERKERIKLICDNCKKEFYLLQCQLTRGRGKYCSPQCRFEGGRTQVVINCKRCGIECKKFPCELDNDNSFCSKKCYDLHRRENASPDTYLKGANGVNEHIIIAEKHLGRKLKRGEVVHHHDEIKHNNNPDNLYVLPTQRLHAAYHFSKNKINISQYKLIK